MSGCRTCGGGVQAPKVPTSKELFVKAFENKTITTSDGKELVLVKDEKQAEKL